MNAEMKNNQRVVCIIQARMSSSRLPGKVMKDICGSPMIDWVVQRAAKSHSVDAVMVATTADASDDLIKQWCVENSVVCYRGEVFDVLDRFYQAALIAKADVIVRLTADCPLIDPSLIDDVIHAFNTHGVDFAANRLPPPYKRTYPIGLDVEVVSFSGLERAWQEAKLKYEREHVFPYIYAEEGRFNVFVLDAEQDYGDYRWTVDTPEDLQFVQSLMEKMDCDRDAGWLDILECVKNNPALAAINAEVPHKSFNDVDQRSDIDQEVKHE